MSQVLSARRFLRLIKTGQVVIDGFDERNVSEHGQYTFTLAETLKAISREQEVDSRRPGAAIRIHVRMHPDGLVMRPGEFFVLETAERLRMSPRIACWLSAHPQLAQVGLSLTNDSFFVRPGTDCRLKLETTNHGPADIRLFPGIRAVKAVFVEGG